MPESIIFSLIIATASFLQGLTGFGFVLIALPLLLFYIPLKVIIPLVCLLALCVSLVLAFQLRRHIDYKIIALLTLANIVSVPIGVSLLKLVPAQALSLALGVLMVAFTLHQLLVHPVCRPLGHKWTIVAGLTSGLLAGSIGAGGPPVIVYSSLCPWDKDKAKGSLAAFFAISGIIVCSTHAVSGLTSHTVLRLFWTALPSLIIGFVAGAFAYSKLSDKGYRRLAIYLVMALGFIMIYRNL